MSEEHIKNLGLFEEKVWPWEGGQEEGLTEEELSGTSKNPIRIT